MEQSIENLEAVMDINDIKHLAVERIFLIPDASEGQLGYVWCDDPAPGVGMDASEAVEYVRKDVHEAHIAELEEREAALAAHVERLRSALNYSSEYLYGSHLNTIGHGSKAHMEMVSALDDTPATSLTCRDLIKQAEALERVEGAMVDPQDAATMRLNAADLRRKPEAHLEQR